MRLRVFRARARWTITRAAGTVKVHNLRPANGGQVSLLPPAHFMAHILVIDDDDGVRKVTVALLRDDSHQVTEARSGGEALALNSLHHPDLVITDLNMPEQNGTETIRILRRASPGLPIIAISGAPESDLFYTAGELVGRNRTLAKPFRRHRLLELVNEAIAPVRSQLACAAIAPA